MSWFLKSFEVRAEIRTIFLLICRKNWWQEKLFLILSDLYIGTIKIPHGANYYFCIFSSFSFLQICISLYTFIYFLGVPSGLTEFIAPLQRAGLCVMTPQPTSLGKLCLQFLIKIPICTRWHGKYSYWIIEWGLRIRNSRFLTFPSCQFYFLPLIFLL